MASSEGKFAIDIIPTFIIYSPYRNVYCEISDINKKLSSLDKKFSSLDGKVDQQFFAFAGTDDLDLHGGEGAAK